QRLDGHHLAGAQVDLGLVVELELATGERPVQRRLERQALDHRGPHPVVEHLVAGAALLLGPVHGGVGVRAEALGRVGGPRVRNRGATSTRSWSPAPWPRLSLTTLKRSRSRNSTATWRPVRSVRSRACPRRSRNSTRFGRAG